MRKEFERKVRSVWRRVRGTVHQAQRLVGVVGKTLFRPELPVDTSGQLLVHLGCGPIDIPGYVNVDMMPLPHVHYVGGVQRLKMFADQSVDVLYACHVLEHVPRRELKETLSEWRRVIKASGVVRISVPDFDLLLKMRDAEGTVAAIQDPLFGSFEHAYDVHHSAFTEASLTALFLAEGFSAVRRWEPKDVGLDSVGDWATRKATGKKGQYFVSLNLEAVR